jgi:hypothetical protein
MLVPGKPNIINNNGAHPENGALGHVFTLPANMFANENTPAYISGA